MLMAKTTTEQAGERTRKVTAGQVRGVFFSGRGKYPMQTCYTSNEEEIDRHLACDPGHVTVLRDWHVEGVANVFASERDARLAAKKVDS